MATKYRCVVCGKIYDQMKQDGFCSNTNCYGIGLLESFEDSDIYKRKQVTKSNFIPAKNNSHTTLKDYISKYVVSQSENICNSGHGNIVRKNITTKDTKIKLSGYGNITLSGFSKSQKTKLSGHGIIDARCLLCLNSTIKLSGYGDAYIVAMNELNAEISGHGNIYCFGSPKIVNIKTTGYGNVFFYNLENSIPAPLLQHTRALFNLT